MTEVVGIVPPAKRRPHIREYERATAYRARFAAVYVALALVAVGSGLGTYKILTNTYHTQKVTQYKAASVNSTASLERALGKPNAINQDCSQQFGTGAKCDIYDRSKTARDFVVIVHP